MKELHTPGPWYSEKSTEDYQGHFVMGGSRTVAATYTVESTDVTKEDFANASLIVAAPTMLQALRRIAGDANFQHEDGAMDLGERLIAVERGAKAALDFYDAAFMGQHEGSRDMADTVPRVIVVVEGGLVQSIIADRRMNVNVLDHDNWRATDRASNPQEWLRFAALAEEIERGDLLEQAN